MKPNLTYRPHLQAQNTGKMVFGKKMNIGFLNIDPANLTGISVMQINFYKYYTILYFDILILLLYLNFLYSAEKKSFHKNNILCGVIKYVLQHIDQYLTCMVGILMDHDINGQRIK